MAVPALVYRALPRRVVFGSGTLGAAIPAIVEDGTNEDARADALFGAWPSGTVLGSPGEGLTGARAP
jgi:hypothetical protein